MVESSIHEPEVIAMKRLIPLLLTAMLLLCGVSQTALAENLFHFDKTVFFQLFRKFF